MNIPLQNHFHHLRNPLFPPFLQLNNFKNKMQCNEIFATTMHFFEFTNEAGVPIFHSDVYLFKISQSKLFCTCFVHAAID